MLLISVITNTLLRINRIRPHAGALVRARDLSKLQLEKDLFMGSQLHVSRVEYYNVVQ